MGPAWGGVVCDFLSTAPHGGGNQEVALNGSETRDQRAVPVRCFQVQMREGRAWAAGAGTALLGTENQGGSAESS